MCAEETNPSSVFFQISTLVRAPSILTPRVKCHEIEEIVSVV